MREIFVWTKFGVKYKAVITKIDWIFPKEHEKLSGGFGVFSISESIRFWPKDIALGTADVNIVYTLCIWVFDKV